MEICDVELLVEQYGDSLYRYCKSLTYSLEDAEDLYQQTFLKTLELHKRILPDKNPKAYLMSVASNIWRNHKSKYARHERIAPVISSESEGVQIADMKGEGDVLEQLVREEELADLKNCVERLPEKQKQVIKLFYAGELPIEDIARVLKIPKGTVKSRLYQAKERLREEMGVC